MNLMRTFLLIVICFFINVSFSMLRKVTLSENFIFAEAIGVVEALMESDSVEDKYIKHKRHKDLFKTFSQYDRDFMVKNIDYAINLANQYIKKK